MRTVCDALGVPPSLLKALIHLSPDQGQPMRDLAEHFGADASYITALVDNLEKLGCVERRPNPTDRRIKTVVLTPLGVEYQARLFELLSEPPKGFDVLTAGEQRQLRDLLRKVAEADPVLAKIEGGFFHAHPAPTSCQG
jgi:DNA-binding MarR family transcriptional regulator